MYKLGIIGVFIFGLSLLKAQDLSLKSLEESQYFSDINMAQNLEEALTFQKYPSYEQYDSMMHYFANSYPDLCLLDTIGSSIDGRQILVLKISDHPHINEAEPAFMYSSTMHGDEIIGYNLLLRLAHFLLENYATNLEVQRVVDQVEIWINPLANPDGSYRDDNSTLRNAIRENSNAVDLNRDFPNIYSGETNDTHEREQETQAMMEFLRDKRFNLSANLHSGEEVVNYPWDYTPTRHPDDDWWMHVSREYADLVHDVDDTYMNGFADGITNGWDWYYAYGTRQDYQTFFLNGRELTLELYYSKMLVASKLEEYWQKNKWSLMNYMMQASYGIHGTVRSADSGIPLKAKIEVIDHDESFIRIHTDHGHRWASADSFQILSLEEESYAGTYIYNGIEHGDFYRYLKEGSYDLRISSQDHYSKTIENVQVVDFQKTLLEITLNKDPKSTLPNEAPGTFRIYPNPARECIWIELPEGAKRDMTLEIVDLWGRKVHAETFFSGMKDMKLDLAMLRPGSYVIIAEGYEPQLLQILK